MDTTENVYRHSVLSPYSIFCAFTVLKHGIFSSVGRSQHAALKVSQPRNGSILLESVVFSFAPRRGVACRGVGARLAAEPFEDAKSGTLAENLLIIEGSITQNLPRLFVSLS